MFMCAPREARRYEKKAIVGGRETREERRFEAIVASKIVTFIFSLHTHSLWCSTYNSEAIGGGALARSVALNARLNPFALPCVR